MTRGRDRLNYDPGKDQISPSDLVGGGEDLERARNQELVRTFPVAREEPVDVPQVEQVDREIAQNNDVVPLARPTERPNISALEDSAQLERDVAVDKLATLRALYNAYPDVDTLALVQSELDKQQSATGRYN